MRCIPLRIDAVGLIARVGLTFPKSEGGKDHILWLEALVDTGATDTALSIETAQLLDLPEVGQRELITPTGRIEVGVFHADLALSESEDAFLFRDRWLAGLMHRQAQFDVVLGMDLLRKGQLTFDGPGSTASFCW